jgi:predicted esterase
VAGNAENLHLCAEFAATVRKECCATTYVLEYPGYFVNAEAGTQAPSEAAIKQAAAALASRLAGQPLPLLLMGYSLGSAAAVHAATCDPVRATNAMLVLMAPLLGGLRTFMSVGLLASLVGTFDVFRTDAAASTLALKSCMVFHGTEDKVVPCWHGQRLAEALRAHTPSTQFWAMPDTNHDTVREKALPLFGAGVRKWLAS